MFIFIDDEPHFISAFVQAFEITGFTVNVIDNVDDAWEKISSMLDDIDAVILDIMMPPGNLFTIEETKNGLHTGFVFIEKMAELDERIPIIVLTNTDRSKFQLISHRHCFIYEKKSVDPWNLVDLIKKINRRAIFND